MEKKNSDPEIFYTYDPPLPNYGKETREEYFKRAKKDRQEAAARAREKFANAQ